VGKGISDKAGRVAIPDGDYEYWLLIVKADYELNIEGHSPYGFVRDYGSRMEWSLVSYLSGPEVVVEMRRMRRQQLEMVVLVDGEPAADRTLYADQWSCSCAVCEVELATTDAQGQISLEDFYPDQWVSIYFTGTNGFAWGADPKQLPADQVIQVNLGE
jgi:hypothetical protein